MPCSRGSEPGEERRLHRAGDRRQDRAQRPGAPSRASAARLGVARRGGPASARRRSGRACGARWSGRADASATPAVRRSAGASPGLGDAGRLAAQDRVALEELALVDGGLRLERREVEPPALGEEGDRVVPDDRARSSASAMPALAHERDRLRHLERIAHAPVGGAVDRGCARCRTACTSATMRGSSIFVLGIDRVAGPAARSPARAAASPRCCGRSAPAPRGSPTSRTSARLRSVPRFLSRCGVWIRTGRSKRRASSSWAAKYFSSSGVRSS